MLIKAKANSTSSDPRQRAGDDAERQMAFLLDRRFEERDDVFLLHDLRILKGKSAFQIDHLIITRYGIALVESKSIHSKISITRHDERREHWSREFRGREEGIPSPVRQVEEQARLLKDVLNESREKILGKLLFVLQKAFGFCPFDTYVGVSTSAVFDLAAGTPLPERVFKADEVAPEIDRRLKAREKQDTLFTLNPLAELPWSISRDDALTTARFLLSQHTPLKPESVPSPEPVPVVARPAAAPTPTPAPILLKAGDTCPACGKHVLAVAACGPVKADGSRDRCLACLGNRDRSCTWTGPLEVVAAPLVVAEAAQPETPAEPIAAATPAGGKSYYCYDCRVAIANEVAKFCWDRQERFGGKAYCRSCQPKFRKAIRAGKPGNRLRTASRRD
jgi:hypothetical protein